MGSLAEGTDLKKNSTCKSDAQCVSCMRLPYTSCLGHTYNGPLLRRCMDEASLQKVRRKLRPA